MSERTSPLASMNALQMHAAARICYCCEHGRPHNVSAEIVASLANCGLVNVIDDYVEITPLMMDVMNELKSMDVGLLPYDPDRWEREIDRSFERD